MKYLLGIGFVITQKYKKDPIARVYIDDTFIDELTLDDWQGFDKLWNRDTNLWIYQRDYTNFFYKTHTKIYSKDFDHFPKKFKLYLLDEKQLKSKKQLKIEIQNSDSNYTNGFMTKTTMINFYTFLVPVPFIKFFSKDGEDIRTQFNHAIVDERYAYTNFPLNKPWVTKNNRREIGYMMTSRFLSKEGYVLRRAEGYPFASKYFWNGECTDTNNFGGSGKFTVDLLTRESGTVTYDTYDDQNIKEQKQGKIDQACGFHLSEKFFSMAHGNMFDKYLRNENQ